MTYIFEEISGQSIITAALIGLAFLPLLYYVALLASYVHRTRKRGKQLDQIPGPPKHWLMGTLHLVG